MKQNLPAPKLKYLPVELRTLVKQAVGVLGEVIRHELGSEKYREIETIRREMTGLRGQRGQGSSEAAYRRLDALLRKMRKMPRTRRLEISRAFGLMLETMNACENAYRSWKLSGKLSGKLQAAPPFPARKKPEAMVLVVTAHPTEARAPGNVAIFHLIQTTLVAALEGGFEVHEESLRHQLELAWRTPIARGRRPTVLDEAEHIYGLILRDEILTGLLSLGGRTAPVLFRSWVGGDKDGHPGVDEKTMVASLQASRRLLVRFVRTRLAEVRSALEWVGDPGLRRQVRACEQVLEKMRILREGDAGRMQRLVIELRRLTAMYAKEVGTVHPALRLLEQLQETFPALVVPLEFRESSFELMKAALIRPSAGARSAPAILRMLAMLRRISAGGSATGYVRGLVISMTSQYEHVRAGELCVRKWVGRHAIPVIPLFEQSAALEAAPEIVERMARAYPRYLEVMVGYSDSAKEKGVLPSRLAICEAVQRIDRLCRKRGVNPIFFHGSGGSVDRGGGSIQEQTAWWPRSALRLYKATIQGEMVERTFASPEIARGFVERIARRAEEGLRSREAPARCWPVVARFAGVVADRYMDKVASEEFLRVVQHATDYPFLEKLKMGSRPSARTKVLSVSSLRAIPWFLCWTQARVLFPTWWGVGSAWESTGAGERKALRKAFQEDLVFSSFVKQLGFTLKKVELPVWRVYLENSGLPHPLIRKTLAEFEAELESARRFVQVMSGSRNLLWFRPWLGESILLRSAMIHPLNLLQVISQESGDFQLIRETVTGISSGMMTTG